MKRQLPRNYTTISRAIILPQTGQTEMPPVRGHFYPISRPMLFQMFILCLSYLTLASSSERFGAFDHFQSRQLLERLPDDDPPTSTQQLVTFLNNASKHINGDCYGRRDDGTTQDIKINKYSHIFGTSPIFYYTLCISTNEIGNHLGQYLNHVACAEVAGAHFLAVPKHFHTAGHDVRVHHEQFTIGTSKKYLELFYDFLPHVIVHPHPQTAPVMRERIGSLCRCSSSCWSDRSAPWLSALDSIQDILFTAIYHYLDVTNAWLIGTLLNKYDLRSDIASLPHLRDRILRPSTQPTQPDTPPSLAAPAPDGRRLHIPGHHPKPRVHHETNYTTPLAHSTYHLPLLPNITLHYRCGDNIANGQGHGVIPFKTFSKARLLSRASLREDQVHFIYVLTEHPQRAKLGKCPDCCNNILTKLFEFLTQQFPQAFIVIKRGGDVFLDMARIAYSPVVFCSPSTFCLWPAIANKYGTVFMPFSPLLGGAANSTLAPKLGKNKHWIPSKMVTHFDTPQKLVDLLMTKE